MMEMYLIIEYEDDQVLVTINREVVNSVSHSVSDIRFFYIDFVCTSIRLISFSFLLGCQVLLESINVHSIKANRCTVARAYRNFKDRWLKS